MSKLKGFPDVTEEITKPKDLRIKIGTKMESFWTQLKENIEKEIITDQASIDMNKVLIPFIEEKIKKEKDLNTSKE